MADRCFPNQLAGGPQGPPSAASTEDLRRVEDRLIAEIRASQAEANCDATVYTGGPGIAYLFVKAAALRGEAELLDDAARLLGPWERDLVQAALQTPGLEMSLLCGLAGWHCVDALCRHFAGDAAGAAAAAEAYASLPSLQWPRAIDADEWLYGRAGYLHGCTLLRHVLGRSAVADEVLASVSEAMLASGAEHAARTAFAGPLMWQFMGTEYLGAAHGVMGNVHALLHVEAVLADPGRRRHLVETLEWLAAAQTVSGNWPVAQGSAADHLVHFCHGAPGAALLFCRAHEALGDARWLEAAEKAGECVWRCGLLRKGPGLCHGMAGNGYALLALYRATGDERWLLRAHHFARLMLRPEVARLCRRPDHPLSLFEGTAGAACFLLDLRLAPAAAAFPLFEVGGLGASAGVRS